MSLHLLQHRVLAFDNKEKPKLPQKVTLEINLAPEDAFGRKGATNRTTFRVGKPVRLTVDLNEGINRVKEASKDTLINLIKTNFKRYQFEFNIIGNKLFIQFKPKSYEELNTNLASINHCIPTYLSLYLGNYIWIKKFRVKILNQEINYRLLKSTSTYTAATKKTQTEKIEKSINNWLELGGKYDRILCASLYWRQADRISKSEFNITTYTAEILLNLNKAIEIIFDSHRDNIREIARNWGIPEEIVEEQIIPINIIRNHFDVGHITTGILSNKERDIMSKFLTEAKKNVREILELVIQKYFAGEIELDEADLQLKKEKKELLNRIDAYL